MDDEDESNWQQTPLSRTLLSFNTSPHGDERLEVVRLSDLICWRHLEGRSCVPHGQQPSTSAVLVPIVPPGSRKQRHAAGSQAQQDVVHAPHSTSAAPKVPQTFSAASSMGAHGGVDVHRLIAACHAVADQLRAADIAIEVDDDMKITPGGSGAHDVAQASCILSYLTC